MYIREDTIAILLGVFGLVFLAVAEYKRRRKHNG